MLHLRESNTEKLYLCRFKTKAFPIWKISLYPLENTGR